MWPKFPRNANDVAIAAYFHTYTYSHNTLCDALGAIVRVVEPIDTNVNFLEELSHKSLEILQAHSIDDSEDIRECDLRAYTEGNERIKDILSCEDRSMLKSKKSDDDVRSTTQKMARSLHSLDRGNGINAGNRRVMYFTQLIDMSCAYFALYFEKAFAQTPNQLQLDELEDFGMEAIVEEAWPQIGTICTEESDSTDGRNGFHRVESEIGIGFTISRSDRNFMRSYTNQVLKKQHERGWIEIQQTKSTYSQHEEVKVCRFIQAMLVENLQPLFYVQEQTTPRHLCSTQLFRIPLLDTSDRNNTNSIEMIKNVATKTLTMIQINESLRFPAETDCKNAFDSNVPVRLQRMLDFSSICTDEENPTCYFDTLLLPENLMASTIASFSNPMDDLAEWAQSSYRQQIFKPDILPNNTYENLAIRLGSALEDTDAAAWIQKEQIRWKCQSDTKKIKNPVTNVNVETIEATLTANTKSDGCLAPTTRNLMSKFMDLYPQAQEMPMPKSGTESINCDIPSKLSAIQQLARPAVWCLMTRKLLRIDSKHTHNILEKINLETLELIVLQLQSRIQQIIMNPSGISHSDLIENCSSFRCAALLHTLRLFQLCVSGPEQSHFDELRDGIVQCTKYQALLGKSHINDIKTRLGSSSCIVEKEQLSNSEPNICTDDESDHSEHGPVQKKPRLACQKFKRTPFRTFCAVRTMQSKYPFISELSSRGITFIDRELSEPIDLIFDERNGFCVFDIVTFEDEAKMKEITYQLALTQIQFGKIWIIIALDYLQISQKPIEDNVIAFYAALVHFQVEIQILYSSSISETCQLFEEIAHQCADAAFTQYHVFPRMWYERPFLLEQESQHEEFLVSTGILNHYAAQSLLHKISLQVILSRGYGASDLLAITNGILSKHQLEAMLKMIKIKHGLFISGDKDTRK